MNSSIHFHSECISFALKQKKQAKNWIKTIAESFKKEIDFINFIFCSDNYLKEINHKHLNHNYFTDIVTFNYNSENKISGDLFLSIDRIRENAKTYQVTFEEELHRVMCHGILHLIGFNDKTASEQKIMREKENFCLSLKNFNTVSRETFKEK